MQRMQKGKGSRRELIQWLAMVPLAGIAASVASACEEADGGDEPGSASDPTIACDGVGARSNLVLGHTHDVCVRALDLEKVPAAGVSLATTTMNGHTHRVEIDAVGLAALRRGEVVRVTTAEEAEHVHTFVLARGETFAPT